MKTMTIMINSLAVGGAGFLGAVLRYWIAAACGRLFGPGFPVGTMVINLSGSFFLAWFATVVGQRVIVSEPLRLAVAVGFVGAYTTFSTWMWESNGQIENGELNKALFNILGSLVLGLLAVRAGIWLAGR